MSKFDWTCSITLAPIWSSFFNFFSLIFICNRTFTIFIKFQPYNLWTFIKIFKNLIFSKTKHGHNYSSLFIGGFQIFCFFSPNNKDCIVQPWEKSLRSLGKLSFLFHSCSLYMMTREMARQVLYFSFFV